MNDKPSGDKKVMLHALLGKIQEGQPVHDTGGGLTPAQQKRRAKAKRARRRK
jgi:hypothetical protein